MVQQVLSKQLTAENQVQRTRLIVTGQLKWTFLINSSNTVKPSYTIDKLQKPKSKTVLKSYQKYYIPCCAKRSRIRAQFARATSNPTVRPNIHTSHHVVVDFGDLRISSRAASLLHSASICSTSMPGYCPVAYNLSWKTFSSR